MLMRKLGLGAVLLVTVFTAAGARAEEDDEPLMDAPAGTGSATARRAELGTSTRRDKRRGGKRRHSSKFSGRVVPEDQLRTEPLPRPSGNLAVESVANPSDTAEVNIYNPDGSYNPQAIEAINHVLRCRRTDAEKPIDLQLLTILSAIYDHFGNRPLQIVSGYRNQRKQTSNHFKGRASDIRIAGVAPKKIRAFAETLDRGGMGIGIYPRSQFVHVDVRPPPSYRWVDYSAPNPNAREKQPPRGWKRHKLQS